MIDNINITKYELDCIRFYMGDFEIVNRGDFEGGAKAYNTINALLHHGTENEIEKIREGKKIEIFSVSHLKTYIELILNIFYAMEKFRREGVNNNLVTYRIDRNSSIKNMKDKNIIEGFYSTCKRGFLEEYAHTKLDIVLIEIHRDKDVPYLDFEKLFQSYYAKPQEAEILLPFGARIVQVEEMKLSDQEKKRYTDKNGRAPEGKYRLVVCNSYYDHLDDIDLNQLYSYITSKDVVDEAKECISKLMNKEVLSDERYSFYVDWKEKIQLYINGKILLKSKEF